MRIYLIRHGETTGDVEDRYGGDYDDHLSKRGVEESKELAGKLKGRGIQKVYTSPKMRAKETAEIAGRELKVAVEVVAGLRERNRYGVMTGMKKSEAKRRYPKEVRELEKGFRHKVKGSESYENFKRRVVKAFIKVESSRKYESVAVVTHGGPMKCIVREVLKAGELGELEDCAIITIEKSDDRLKIIGMDGAMIPAL